MKKAYINPEASFVLLTEDTIICTSVDGFNKIIDNEHPIDTDKMLSRENRRDVWEDEELEEEY